MIILISLIILQLIVLKSIRTLFLSNIVLKFKKNNLIFCDKNIENDLIVIKLFASWFSNSDASSAVLFTPAWTPIVSCSGFPFVHVFL